MSKALYFPRQKTVISMAGYVIIRGVLRRGKSLRL